MVFAMVAASEETSGASSATAAAPPAMVAASPILIDPIAPTPIAAASGAKAPTVATVVMAVTPMITPIWASVGRLFQVFVTAFATLDSGLCDAASRAVQSLLDNPGPRPINNQGVGVWGQDLLAPVLRPLGFVTRKAILTSLGDLEPDFFNPVTGQTIDSKVGGQSLTDFEDTQMDKYALDRMSGQTSGTTYLFLKNPWIGTTMDNPNYLQALDDYGILHKFLDWVT